MQFVSIPPTSTGSPEREINHLRNDFGNDSDDLDSLPSVKDFFDEILSHTYEKPVVEILDDDDDDSVVMHGKGKERAVDFKQTNQTFDLEDKLSLQNTTKTQRGLEVEERKRKQEEATREKKEIIEDRKRKRIQLAEEKKRLKEQKQLEKERQTLYEKENRLRNDRNEILKEMILDIHPDFLESTKTGKLLEIALQKKEVDVQNLLIQNPHDPAYTIAWRRKCRSEWNTSSQSFIPLQKMKIVNESVVLVYVESFQFVQHIKNNTVDDYINRIQQSCQNRQVILMIEGLDSYYKKKRLLRRRQFDSQVRSTIMQQVSSTGARKRKNRNHPADEDITNGPEPAVVEECMNYLQLVRHIMFVLTKDDEDSVSWIESLTTDLGLGRYKSKNINNSYRVSKSGTDPQDTYFKMLQEIQLCTPAIAKSIIYAYPTVQSLHQSYEIKDKSNGELMLADLEVERSTFKIRDRKVNRVMSKKIYTIFNSDDPEQIIY
ncbi:MAG: hypothetical protein EXX96DRAFT_174921 [Benjaminiella poitrasii]|nr:MAG: hypothetical protein EXX96DRAFT_174921 [Benjaminiella poitrasii]